MTLQVPNPSNFLGAQSPHWLAVALNTSGLSFSSNSSDVTPLTTIIAEMVEGTIAFAFRISEGFANNESLELAMSYISLDGSGVTSASITLDDTNTPSAGGEFAILQRGVFIPAGSVVAIVRTYTAGGQANNPTVAILAQFY